MEIVVKLVINCCRAFILYSLTHKKPLDTNVDRFEVKKINKPLTTAHCSVTDRLEGKQNELFTIAATLNKTFEFYIICRLRKVDLILMRLAKLAS